ncbi:MAG: hypothetical protein QM709_08455 [Spongiibacteraceae bacterium]
MKTSILASALLASVCLSPVVHADFKEGDKLQTLTNLHPDVARRQLYTMNYQQPGLIPVCSDVTVKKISGKEMVFDYQGVEYSYEYEKYTKGAGVSFQAALETAFGPACDKAKIGKLSQADQEGIRSGKPRVGMTKDGIYFALGRPPQHANPSLDVSSWLYWENRFGKMGIDFDDKGKVVGIR